jgi:hypothetical protein
MAAEDSVFDSYVDASATALGLVLESDWKAAASANLAVIFRLAAAIEGFELPDGIEPAPVFEA